MATPTPNLGLIKPDMPDEVDQTIPALAENFGKIDTAITDNSNGLAALKADVTQGRYNVKSAPYNATGNGTTNDLAAIQAAIDAAYAAGGGIVFFPKGTYYIQNGGASITYGQPNWIGLVNLVLKPNVSLVGSGKQSVILLENSIKNWIFPYDGVDPAAPKSSNNIIRDLTIKSQFNGTNPDTQDSYGIRGCLIDSLIENVWFEDFDSDAVCFITVAPTGTTIRGCHVNNCGRHGLTYIRGDRLVIDGNYVSNCVNRGINGEQDQETDTESRIKVINNYIWNCVKAIGFAIYNTDAGRENGKSNLVNGNTIWDCDYGLEVSDGKSFIITNNHFTNVRIYGIELVRLYNGICSNNTFIDVTGRNITINTCYKVIAEGNRIYNSPTAVVATEAIYLLNGEGLDVSHNYIENTLNSGILAQRLRDCRINHNTILNTCQSRADSAYAAIRIAQNSGDVREGIMINGNILADRQTVPTMYTGIRLSGTTYVRTLVGHNICSNQTATNYVLSDATAVSNI